MHTLKLGEGLCNCLSLRQASRQITAYYDQAMADSGLRITQFSILYKLAKYDSLTINDLSAEMVMDRTTLARNLKPLEREDYVKVSHGEDRRERIVELTSKGQEKFTEMLPMWRKVQRQFESIFGSERALNLRETLREVVSGVPI
jgi:DNA-binding MarR family transcriptional regulator